VAADRTVREGGALKPAYGLALGAAVIALLAFVPKFAGGYQLALGISLLYFTVLAVAWALFSGPTHYISLATVAFFGIGQYTVAVAGEWMPWPAVVAVAALIGIAVALVVGLSTLRLSGIYFVIFTFGLSELLRQIVSWYEININRSVGRYIFLSITTEQIYWQLLALVALVLLVGWLITRSRLGLALRVIGNDEVVARHAGIDTTQVKLAMFAISALFMTVTGAIMAPRWTYIDPAIAFSPMLSFEVVIMALLGGAATLFGPVLGAVTLALMFEVLTAKFPNHFSILLGVVFVLIVYVLPRGVIGLFPARPHNTTMAAAPPVPGELKAAQGASLEVAGLRKAFGGLVAADDISFRVERGELIGLIGPNGSGKTTVLNLISGALSADAGAILFKGQDLTRTSAHRIARLGLARTFQLVRVLESMTVLENVMVGLAFRGTPLTGAKGEAAAAALLARVGLAGKGGLPTGQLTYIDQKRLELARALALEPDLLLLDEWLAGLNPSELAEGIALIRSLRASGITIIMVEHVMDAIRSLCDRCVVMNVGRKIAEGPPAAVLADKEVVRAYLGGADA
jgi:branched-chain amino acid transport system permease protein